jgi:hypothetical protein
MNSNHVKLFLLVGTFALVCCTLQARDGLIFDDVAPISVAFHSSEFGHSLCIINTSKETLYEITFSKTIEGKVVRHVISAIRQDKGFNFFDLEILRFLDKFSIPHDGPFSGMTVTCKYYSKPVAIKGWWDDGLRLKQSVWEQYRKESSPTDTKP